MGGSPAVRSICPVASDPVGDLVHAGFKLFELLRLQTRPHDAEAVADPGADLTVERTVSHGSNGHAQGPDRLVEITEVA
jgi:hypothetical protein